MVVRRNHLDNVIAGSVQNELRHGMDFQLTHDVGTMRLGCFGADFQSRPHLFRGLPFGYQASDFELAMSEMFSKD